MHRYHDGGTDTGMPATLDGGMLSPAWPLLPLSILSLDPTVGPGGMAGELSCGFDHDNLESIHPHHVSLAPYVRAPPAASQMQLDTVRSSRGSFGLHVTKR